MKTLSSIVLFALIPATCFSQSDTVVVKNQKGFLFLSNYNYLYDWDGTHRRPLGFHDFFYPVKDFNGELLKDSNVNIIFKNGIRVDRIQGRYGIKTQALSINCEDTSRCYLFRNFYVVPVIIDYKLFEDYEPYVCRRNFYELLVVGGSKLRFEYLHKALLPTRIKIQEETKKKK